MLLTTISVLNFTNDFTKFKSHLKTYLSCLSRETRGQIIELSKLSPAREMTNPQMLQHTATGLDDKHPNRTVPLVNAKFRHIEKCPSCLDKLSWPKIVHPRKASGNLKYFA